MSLDLVNSLIQQTQDPNRPKRAVETVEPIYGTVQGEYQKFSDPLQAQETLTQQTTQPMAAAQNEQSNKEESKQPSMQNTTNTAQKFSYYNPVGGPPPGFRASQSCGKCEYFETGCFENQYKIDIPGFCRKHDFPCTSGYTCDSFEFPGKSSTEVSVFSDSVAPKSEGPPVEDLLSSLERVDVSTTVDEKVIEQPKNDVVSTDENVIDTSVEATASPSEQPKELAEPNPESSSSLVFADTELYSEALELTKTKFRVPDSSIAKEYTINRYKRAYKAKHGTLETAFKVAST